MKKLLFILNPHAGKAQIKGRLLQIVDLMVKKGYDVTIYPTQAKRDASNTRPRRMKQIKSTKIIIRFTNGAGTGLNVSA